MSSRASKVKLNQTRSTDFNKNFRRHRKHLAKSLQFFSVILYFMKRTCPNWTSRGSEKSIINKRDLTEAAKDRETSLNSK